MQGAAAMFVAPAFIKIENLMPVKNPTSKIILPGDTEYDEVMLGQEIGNFQIYGTRSGDRVLLKDAKTGEFLINKAVTDHPINERLLLGKGRDVVGIVMRKGHVSQHLGAHLTGDLQWRIGSFEEKKIQLRSNDKYDFKLTSKEPKEIITDPYSFPS